MTFVDMESAEDRARLAEPMLALKSLRGLIVIDELERTRTSPGTH